jgi:hypothetical protein
LYDAYKSKEITNWWCPAKKGLKNTIGVDSKMLSQNVEQIIFKNF